MSVVPAQRKYIPNVQYFEMLKPQTEVKTQQSNKVGITSESLDLLFLSLDKSGYVNFGDLLELNGFSKEMTNIHFHAQWSNEVTMDFSGCQFDSIQFTGNIVNALFNNTITHCEFQDASISHSLFDHTNIEQCVFLNTAFHADFVQDSYITDTWFINDNIDLTTFANNTITHCIFSEVTTDNALLPNTAYDNTTTQLGFINTFIADDLNQGATNLQQTLPLVGVIGFSDWHSPAVQAVTFNRGQTMTIDPYMLPESILNALDSDVDHCLTDYKAVSKTNELSIPQYILNSQFESIQGVKAIAKNYIDSIDALWIPGDGYDIHPSFYNQPTAYETYSSYSYTREIVEFALIEEALLQHKPIIGVCHGSQMINVYLGGNLHQHVSDQHDDQNLKIEIANGIIGDAIKDGIIGESMHHQAMHHVGEGLEVVATYQGIIKACQAANGDPIFLTQFHPEYMGDESNNRIIQNFVSAAAKSNLHTTAILLGEVLDVDTDLVQSLAIKYKEGSFKFHSDKEPMNAESTLDNIFSTNDITTVEDANSISHLHYHSAELDLEVLPESLFVM